LARPLKIKAACNKFNKKIKIHHPLNSF
jgi:hypothetical protein